METAAVNENCNFNYNWDGLNVATHEEANTSQFFYGKWPICLCCWFHSADAMQLAQCTNITSFEFGSTVGRHPEHERFTTSHNIMGPNGGLDNENEENFNENAAQVIADDMQELQIDTRVPMQTRNVHANPKVQATTTRATTATAATAAITKPAAPLTRSASTSSVKSQSQGPSVYKFTEIYDQKKKLRVEQQRVKERQQRQFHSQPAPNFRAIHAAVDRKKQQISPQITCPKTPAVLRRHKEAQEKIQKMVNNRT